jgi:hypothetical protein
MQNEQIDNNNEKKRRNKPTKAQRYKKERENIIKELLKLMKITCENDGILLCDLEKNDEIKEYIKSQVENIRIYFRCGTLNFFVKQHNQNVSEISLLKSIFKDENYEIVSKKKVLTIDDKKKHLTYFKFIKKNC